MKRTFPMMALLLLPAIALAKPAKATKPAPEMTPETAQLVATQNIAAGDLDGADKVLRDTYQRFPAAHGFHLGRGAVEEARGHVRAALWEYQWELLRAGADRPTGAEAMRRASELVEKGSKDADGVRAVLEAMSMAGTNAEGALKIVKAERAIGDTFVLRVYETELRASAGDRDAEPLFRQVLEIDPNFVPAHVGLANVLGRAGHIEEAKAELASARKIDATHWSLPK